MNDDIYFLRFIILAQHILPHLNKHSALILMEKLALIKQSDFHLQIIMKFYKQIIEAPKVKDVLALKTIT